MTDWVCDELKVKGPLVKKAKEPYPFTGEILIAEGEFRPTLAQLEQMEARLRRMKEELSLQP